MIRDENERKILERLRGMTVALATPLNKEGVLDVDALHRLVDRGIEGGVSSVFALGWMGEQPLLPESVRRQVMIEVVRHVAGRVPVIIGISEQSLPRVLVEAEAAQKAGADILLATPPYSYPISHELIIDYFRQLSSNTRLPLILYNNAETGNLLGVNAVRTISQIPGIIGIKEFSDFGHLQQLINKVQRLGEFIILSGDEYLFAPALLIGAEYSTMGGPGNLVPQWCVQMHRLAKTGNWDKLYQLHRRLVMFCDALYGVGESAYSAVLAALSILGYGSGRAVSPLPSLDPSQFNIIRRILDEFNVR